jgi:hypothetical protein
MSRKPLKRGDLTCRLWRAVASVASSG